jgi:hypothetical protein
MLGITKMDSFEDLEDKCGNNSVPYYTSRFPINTLACMRRIQSQIRVVFGVGALPNFNGH